MRDTRVPGVRALLWLGAAAAAVLLLMLALDLAGVEWRALFN